MPGRYNRVYNPFEEEEQKEYLHALERCGQYIRAADACGLNCQEVEKYRKAHPEYNELCSLALKVFREVIIEEARRRACDGIDRVVVGGRNRDQILTTEKHFSDRLLELFLKRSNDGSFSDKQEIKVDGVDIKTQMDLSSLSTRARAKLRELLEILVDDDRQRAEGKVVE